MRPRGILATLAVVMSVSSGCVLAPPDRSAEFGELVDELRSMPGVNGVRDRYSSGFSQGRELRLEVLVEDAATVGELAAVSDTVRSADAGGQFDRFTRRLIFALPQDSRFYSGVSRFVVGWGGWQAGYDAPAACWLELTHLYPGLVVDTIGHTPGAERNLLDVYLRTGPTAEAGPAGPDTVTAERAITRCLEVGGPGGGYEIRFRLDGPVVELAGSAPDVRRVLALHRVLAGLGGSGEEYAVAGFRMDGDELAEVTVAAVPEAAGVAEPDAEAVLRDLDSATAGAGVPGGEVGEPRILVAE
ncbi:MAG TPA: hypothetical protein H9878_13725 [Candidatus Dietzia merdigallinarum]|nr:hypothetical protein [Candidatus Dietzia merdigallinarum]